MNKKVLQGALCMILSICMLVTSVVPVSASTEQPDSIVEEEQMDVSDENGGSMDQDVDSETVVADSSAIDEVTNLEADVVTDSEISSDNISDDNSLPEDAYAAGATDLDEVTDESVNTEVDSETEIPTLEYSAHVQNIGWQSYVSAGTRAGTTGRHLQMEALKINLTGVEGLGIRYSAHVQNIGWQSFVDDNKLAGTTGKCLPMEAIKIELTGEKAEEYDVYYRVHVTNFGDLGWAKNGEAAGSQGYAYCMQAIEIRVLPKGSSEAPSAEGKAFRENIKLTYSAHVQNIGWQSYVSTGSVAGTTGRALNMEAIKIAVQNTENLGIEYSAHVTNIGWMNYTSNGKIAGTTGKNYSLQALKIRLTGSYADNYDIYYRAHVENLGWLDWAKNGEEAGSVGLNYGMQAIQIKLVAKGSSAPGATAIPCCNKAQVQYTANIRGQEWQELKSNGSTAGIVGKDIDGLQISVSGMQNLGIQYSAHVENVGWQDYVFDGSTAGTPGKNRQVEAVKIKLTGSAAKYYNVWYRVYSERFGWLGWAVNDAKAGTEGFGYAVQAVQIVVRPKGNGAPGTTSNTFRRYGDSQAMQYARQILDQIGWDLKAAFDWSSSKVRYVDVAAPAAGVSHAEYYGAYGFQNRQGNCYVMASTFYWMAKLLGYEVYLVEGEVPLRRGGMGPHGWCEVVIDGTTYVCDPDFTYDAGRNGYLITYGASGTWRYSNYQRVE